MAKNGLTNRLQASLWHTYI